MNRQYEELKEQNVQLAGQLSTMVSLLTSSLHISHHSSPSTPQTSTNSAQTYPPSTSSTLFISQTSNRIPTPTSTATPPHPSDSIPAPPALPSWPIVWPATYSSNSSRGHGTLGPSIPEAKIPNLPRGPNGWKEAVNQWEKIDPDTGYSLKDWPKSWYTGDMKPFTACKRTIRQRIAEEYNR